MLFLGLEASLWAIRGQGHIFIWSRAPAAQITGLRSTSIPQSIRSSRHWSQIFDPSGRHTRHGGGNEDCHSCGLVASLSKIWRPALPDRVPGLRDLSIFVRWISGLCCSNIHPNHLPSIGHVSHGWPVGPNVRRWSRAQSHWRFQFARHWRQYHAQYHQRQHKCTGKPPSPPTH